MLHWLYYIGGSLGRYFISDGNYCKLLYRTANQELSFCNYVRWWTSLWFQYFYLVTLYCLLFTISVDTPVKNTATVLCSILFDNDVCEMIRAYVWDLWNNEVIKHCKLHPMIKFKVFSHKIVAQYQASTVLLWVRSSFGLSFAELLSDTEIWFSILPS